MTRLTRPLVPLPLRLAGRQAEVAVQQEAAHEAPPHHRVAAQVQHRVRRRRPHRRGHRGADRHTPGHCLRHRGGARSSGLSETNLLTIFRPQNCFYVCL